MRSLCDRLHHSYSNHGPGSSGRRPALALAAALLAVAVASCGGSAAMPAKTSSGGAAGPGSGGATTLGTGGSSTTPGSGGATMVATGGTPPATGGSLANTGGSSSGGTGANAGGGTGGTAGTGPNSDAAVSDDAATDLSATGGGGGAVGLGGGGGAAGGAPRDGGSDAAGGATHPLKAIMIITGAGKPTAGDNVMLGRMTARGIQTTTMTDAAVTAAAVAGMDLVVISSSAESGPLAAKVRDVAIPVLCIENGEYALMGMTPATLNTDYGMVAAQTQVQITTAGNPLVGTLTGTVTISSVAGDFGWGVPAAAAIKGASLPGNPNRAVIFGYAKGDQMVSMAAPARRAAFAIRETLAANLTADGLKLFDAVLNWVLM